MLFGLELLECLPKALVLRRLYLVKFEEFQTRQGEYVLLVKLHFSSSFDQNWDQMHDKLFGKGELISLATLENIRGPIFPIVLSTISISIILHMHC